MATWEVALVREQGQTFGVACVKDSLLHNRSKAEATINALTCHFGCDVVLIGARQHRLLGRPDIVRFLSNVSPDRLPWKKYQIAA